MATKAKQSTQQAAAPVKPEQEIVTKAEYARRKNWDRSYLSQAEALSKIAPALTTVSRPGKKDREMIIVDIADKIFAGNTDPSKVRKITQEAAPADGSFTSTKTEREKVRLESESLDLAERKGQTLPRAQTTAAVAAAGTQIREHLQARNRRIAEQASTMTDPREIKAMLDNDDRAMLEMISHDFLRRIQAITGGDGQSIN